MQTSRPAFEQARQSFTAWFVPLLVSTYTVAVGLAASYANLRLSDGLLNTYVIAQPYLIAHGFIPYNHIEDPRTPLLPHMLSWLLPLFGSNAPRTARFVQLIAIVAMAVLVLAWLYRTRGWWAAIAGGAFTLAWMNAFGYWAIAYYEVVLAPLYFAVFLLLDGVRDRASVGRIFIAGLLAGLGILIKQHTGLLAVLLLVWLLFPSAQARDNRPSRLRGLAFLALGLALPLLAYSVYFFRMGGDFREWLYWNVTYILTGSYSAQGRLLPNAGQIRQILPGLILVIPYVVVAVLAPQGASFSRSRRLWLLGFLLAASVFLYPRYSARHWAAAFPFLVAISAVVCADIVDAVRRSPAKIFNWGLSAALVLWWFLASILAYGPKLIYPAAQKFSEYSSLIPLAEALKPRLPPGSVAIVPVYEANANLYYLLDRLPPRYQFDFYPYFTNERTVRKWLQAMESERPPTLLYFEDRLDLASFSPEILEYVEQHYHEVDTLAWEGSEVQVMSRQDGK